ncbi:hypothetical protein NQ317_019082 [Molorchus minor]|uniref:Centrosomal protein of 89 kDa n=1 Tax=Molorchus minor TaxID=1323400 RepID=A0ABQ9JMG6_9CUCU|nr:hypothetical protein NQ317_019082 [Molorchus minor]
MLPLFQIITSDSPTQDMPTHDTPIKSRRKNVEVPIHRTHGISHESRKKTFSANFNSRKCKNKDIARDDPNFNAPVHAEVVVEIPESDWSIKNSKKLLAKEIIRLGDENKELYSKFNELEELSVKKITKLRDKIHVLQNTNSEIDKENAYLKEQYQGLLGHYEEVRKELEGSRVCKTCQEFKVSLEKYSADNNLLRISNKELSQDLEMLKTVVYRLNVQLERYQGIVRNSNMKIPKSILSHADEYTDEADRNENISRNILSEVHHNHSHTPIAWGSANTHTLGPLLDAYDDTIKEKEEIITSYELEMSNFTGRLKEIIEENEVLHEKLTEDEGCSVKLLAELENLRKELKSTRDQNDLLIKKCALKQDKVEEILKVYENKVNQMKRDYNVMHEEYIKCRTERAALKERNKALEDVQDDFKNQMQSYIPLSVHTASVNECKRWYEELKQQYENEKQKLKESIEGHIQTIGELKKENQRPTRRQRRPGIEGGSIRETYKCIKQPVTVTISLLLRKSEAKHLDLEHALNEVQLSRSALRKQLHKVMVFAKDMVAEQETLLKALNQRHLENKAVKRIGSDMASKMDSLRNQLKDVQKNAWQEFTTVEQKIQEQNELIDSMKEEHRKEIERLNKTIKEQEEMALLLKNNASLPKPPYLLYQEKYRNN